VLCVFDYVFTIQMMKNGGNQNKSQRERVLTVERV
jgi:hypothetical protein